MPQRSKQVRTIEDLTVRQKKFIDIFKTNKYQAVQGSKSSVKSILFDKFDVLDKIKQYKIV